MTKMIQTSGRACCGGRAKIDIGFIIAEERMTMDGIAKKSAGRAAAGKAKRRLEIRLDVLYRQQREHLNREVHRRNNVPVDLLS